MPIKQSYESSLFKKMVYSYPYMKPAKTRKHFTIWTTREIIMPYTKVSQGFPQTGYNTGNGYAYVNEGE